MILVLLGPHGAGKTTLGRALSRRLAAPFDDEIGRRLAAARPATETAATAQPSFDDAVLEEELSRDATRPASHLHVVETWHPGNLAFTSLRSPARLPAHQARIRQHLRPADVLVVSLWAPRGVLRARQSEAAALSFFLKVGRRAERFARRLGLPLLARLRSDREPAEAQAERVALLLQRQRARSSSSAGGLRGAPLIGE